MTSTASQAQEPCQLSALTPHLRDSTGLVEGATGQTLGQTEWSPPWRGVGARHRPIFWFLG